MTTTLDYRYEFTVFADGGVIATDWKHGEPITLDEWFGETLEKWQRCMAKFNCPLLRTEFNEITKSTTYYYAG